MGTMASTNESSDDSGIPSEPAQRLLAVRTSTGLSQQAFADALGISLRAEQNYERGNRKIPADLLLTLARRFGVDPLWVLQGPEQQFPSLSPSGRLDLAILRRSIKIVRAAVSNSRRNVSDEEFAYWAVAVYQFFEDNPGEKGADELVGRLIRGAAG
jgi:transcriptional regulator with XRE-family HTH domain